MAHSRARIIIDGAIAGIIGALVVAVWFLIFDLIRGHAFETPALLAATILHGSHSHDLHHGLKLLALEYSLLHFGAFIAFGITGGLLLEACETESSLLFSLAIFFVAFEIFFIAVVLFLGPNVIAELTWWGIIVGNLLATAAMLSYFLSRHPALARHLLGGWITVALEGVAAGLVGGLGIVPGANIGDRHAVFEAVHGTAPDIAGKGMANPTALMQSAALMLAHIRERAASEKLQGAVERVYADGQHLTRDVGGTAGTAEFTDAVIAACRA